MKPTARTLLTGLLLLEAPLYAQQTTVSGKVTSEQGTPHGGVTVLVKGTTVATSTTPEGSYSIRANVGQVLQFRSIGTTSVERTVGETDVINVTLRRVATSLDDVVVTALGKTTE